MQGSDQSPAGKQAQDQTDLKSKNPNRPPIDSKDKDQIKKKRKLLSFEDQLQQGSPQKKQKLQRHDLGIKSQKLTKPKSQLNKADLKEIQESLKAQYLQKIEKLKEELFQVDFSYWDGHLVVKKLKRKKKQTIKSLIQVCRLQLIANFQNLASCRDEDLLMVIKDFIVPHKMTVADIQALELKTGKGDLLLNFKNVKIKDMTLSVNCDGPVRIIEKSKYQKNIQAHPFNTWRVMEID